jgi:hypothetical protein
MRQCNLAVQSWVAAAAAAATAVSSRLFEAAVQPLVFQAGLQQQQHWQQLPNKAVLNKVDTTMKGGSCSTASGT